MTARRLVVLLAAVLLALLPLAAATADESTSPSPSASPSATSSPTTSATPEEPRADPRKGLSGVDGLTPVLGSSYGSTAPELKTGRYTDTVPEVDDYRFYSVRRTMPHSTIAFGLTMLGPDVDRRRRPALRVYAKLPEPTRSGQTIRVCGVARVDDDDKATVMPAVSEAGWTFDSKPLCRDADQLFVVVANAYQRPDGDQATMTKPGAPYELDVWEQPQVTNADQLKQVYNDQWVYDAPGTPDVQAAPGAAPVSATVLPVGKTVAVDLPLGRVGWFAVPVEIGERLQALLKVADGAAVAGAGYEMRVYSPVGGSVLIADPSYDLPATNAGNLASGPNLLSAITGEVFPGNRAENESSDYSQHSALTALGGYYLIAVYVQRLDAAKVDSLPVLLKTRVDEHDGFKGDGYHDAVFAGDVTPFPTPRGSKTTAYVADKVSSSPVQRAGRSVGDWALIGGLGLFALVFAGVGGLLLRRRA